MIPKILLQISKEKPDLHNLKLIEKYFSGYTYNHFTDDEIIDFFIKNPLDEFPNCIELFNRIPIGAWKADFFRYYYLYLNGGVFLDSDAMIHCHIDNIIDQYSGIFIKSNYFYERGLDFTHIFNGFICITAKSPIIYECLKHIYNIDFTIIKNYQVFCIEMLKNILRVDISNIQIFEEKVIQNEGKSVVYDKDKIILSHYFQNKKIPIEHI